VRRCHLLLTHGPYGHADTFTEVKLGSESYYIYPGPSTWVAAEDKCTSRGTHLANIGTLHQTDRLVAAFKAALPSSSHFWIGLNDRAREAGTDYGSPNWQWSDGSPLFYTNWDASSREPTGGAAEDCVKVGAGNGWWYDDDCSRSLPFICKSGWRCLRAWVVGAVLASVLSAGLLAAQALRTVWQLASPFCGLGWVLRPHFQCCCGAPGCPFSCLG
jgi:hypothetical protein